MTWQPWVTEVAIEGATGGRRGPGSSNHCRHGKDAVIEEILDWRPYDYVTDRTILDTPGGPLKVLHTIEFEPSRAGTLSTCGSVPQDQARKGADGDIRAGVRRRARVGVPDPGQQLEARGAADDAGRDAEPALAGARRDGPLASLVGGSEA